MPPQIWRVTDPETGQTLRIEGDSSPTEAELNEIFKANRPLASQAPPLEIAKGSKPADAIAQMKAYNEAQGLNPAPESSALMPDPLGSALSFGKGVVSQLNPIEMAKGLYGAVRHPYDTAVALGQSQLGHLQQVPQAIREGRYSEAAGHAGAGVLPLVGPVAAEIGENIGRGNIAEGAGQTLGLVASLNPRAALGVVNKGAQALKATGIGAKVAPMLERAGIEKFASAVSPLGTGKAGRRSGTAAAKVAPEVLREPGMGAWSRAGLQQKVGGILDTLKTKYREMENARDPTKLEETGPIVSHLEGKLKELEAQSASGEAAHARVDELGLGPQAAEEAARALPEYPPAPGTKFSDMHVAYRQELRRLAAELEEFQYQEGRKTEQITDVRREGGAGTGRGARTGRRYTPEYVQAEGGTPVYQEILQGKKGTTRNAMIKSLRRFINGEQKSTPVVERALDVANKRLRTPELTGKPMLPPEAGFDASDAAALPPRDVSGPIGKNVIPPHNAGRAAEIQTAIQLIKDLGPIAAYKEIRKIRQSYDIPASSVYNPTMVDPLVKLQSDAVKAGAADVSGAMREWLAAVDPDTAKLNPDFSQWKKLDDVMKAAEEVDRVRPNTGRRIVSRWLGALAGGEAAGVAGAIGGAILGPMAETIMVGGQTTKIQTARLLTKIADALKKGDVDVATSTLKRLRAFTVMGQAHAAAQPKETEQ